MYLRDVLLITCSDTRNNAGLRSCEQFSGAYGSQPLWKSYFPFSASKVRETLITRDR